MPDEACGEAVGGSMLRRVVVRLGLLVAVPVLALATLAAGLMAGVVLAIFGTIAVGTWVRREWLDTWRAGIGGDDA
jgi:hypothetical protein